MDTSNALAVFADPTRRAIIERLAPSPCSVSQLRDALPVTLSAVSQHLKLLREAGLVTATRRGRYSIYRVAHNRAYSIRIKRGFLLTTASNYSKLVYK